MLRDKMFAYHKWATQELLSHTEKYGDEIYRKEGESSFSSIKETVSHVITVEKLWLLRMAGTEKPAAEHFRVDTAAEAKQAFMLLHAEMELYFSSLSEEQWQEVMAFTNLRGDSFEETREEMLFTFINHASYHRGQVTSLLRQFGKEGKAIDYIYFPKENR
ncbi:DinB family protein [Planococcus sp. CAU13]|uniref:DinB family protein n=1 Tax=Planococcus sp. CAU13 TaxID=1541197 RepID=UPI00052FEF92|nr:DinB family protein [Planococcus sp. CAU13]